MKKKIKMNKKKKEKPTITKKKIEYLCNTTMDFVDTKRTVILRVFGVGVVCLLYTSRCV